MDTYTGKTNVCGRDLNACLHTIEQFHGWKAPGLVVGMFMVDLAMTRIGKGVEFDAILVCSACGEACSAEQGALCAACQGKGHFSPVKADHSRIPPAGRRCDFRRHITT